TTPSDTNETASDPPRFGKSAVGPFMDALSPRKTCAVNSAVWSTRYGRRGSSPRATDGGGRAPALRTAGGEPPRYLAVFFAGGVFLAVVFEAFVSFGDSLAALAVSPGMSSR